jgi:diguanylate cyclase (GGDEF)-like protein
VTDLVILGFLCLGIVVAASVFRPMASLMARARTADGPETDALVALALALPIAATIYARRRYAEAVDVRRQLVRLSLHDALTGLPNRRLLLDWVSAAAKESAAVNAQAAVLFVDLDRFKYVNDTHGHEVGDRLMAAVAERLVDLVEHSGRVLRYGGDEFVVIAPNMATLSATRLAERVISTIELPFTVGTESLRISASVGIALTEQHGVNLEYIVRDADLAMFQAKAKGSGQVVIFDRSLTGALTPANAEHMIRQALNDGELHLFLQPVVAMDSGRIVGAEALLRWVTQDRGAMSPAEFVPILEETGLIVPVGTWVLEEGCRIAARLSALTGGDRVTVTVNVSARQLAQTNFADTVTQAINRAGIDPSQIYLEITEGALMHDVGSAWTVLRQVKALGVGLALDDFGTGYSSLSYVRRFSLDMLKIDKSFIDHIDTSPEDRAIVSHVIGMAHALGMSTVAEGVERDDQLAWLRILGCRAAQGYAMSRPIPVADFEELVVRRRHDPYPIAEIIAGRALVGAVPTEIPAPPPASNVPMDGLGPARPRARLGGFGAAPAPSSGDKGGPLSFSPEDQPVEVPGPARSPNGSLPRVNAVEPVEADHA